MSDAFLLKHPLLYYIRKHPRSFIIGILSLCITNSLDGVYPLLLKTGIDQIESKANLSSLGRTTAMLFAVMFSLSLTRYAWRMGFGFFHTHVAEHIRRKMFNHASQLSTGFFQKNPVGELMSLLTNDVQSFRQAIGPGLLILADGFIIIAIILPIMIGMNPSWTWKCLFFLPSVPVMIWAVMKLIHARYKIQQERFSELTGLAQETVGGIRVIKSFSLEDHRTQMFNKVSAAFAQASNRVAQVDSLFGPVMEFGVASGSVILLFIAKDDIFAGTVTLGTFVAFHRYIQKMVWPMTALGMGLSMYQKGLASFERIKNLLVAQTEVPDTGQIELKEFQSIEFKNVSFAYPDSPAPILKNISFKILAGESVGIMGTVGAGKSTLVHLMLRLFPVSQGQILVNDLPIESYTLSSLRQTLCLVPQEAFLFSQNITENISLGLANAIDFGEIERITQVVDLQNEILALPQKFDSQLGERGINLSGGQKQRMALARGLIIRSPVLILDDSLSAVDTKTEQAIENELQALRKQTRIVIAHRLSTLKNADKIIVLAEGSIEAVGTSAELSHSSPSFQKIIAIQNESQKQNPTEEVLT